MYFRLVPDHVDDVVERRAPYREAHLSLVRGHVVGGEVVSRGASGPDRARRDGPVEAVAGRGLLR